MEIKSWPEVQEFLPPLSTQERNTLHRSASRDGIKNAILVLPDGRIIDGHHRFAIASELEIECPHRVEDIPESDALSLAIALNIARRQLSPNQAAEMRKKLLEDYQQAKEVALQMRDMGHTQAEVAAVIGVTQGAVSQWEKEGLTSIISANNTCKSPDCRVKVPKGENAIIYQRHLEGETQEQIAADYKVSQQVISTRIKRRKKELEKESEKPELKPECAIQSPTLIVGKAESTGLSSESVDLIITSPPYNLKSESWPMGGDGREPRENGIGYDDDLPENRYQAWQLECLAEMYRVAKSGASLFYNHKVRQSEGRIIHPLTWLCKSQWTVRQEIIWDRGSTHNHCPSLFWPHDERIYWLTKGKPELPANELHYQKERDTKYDKRRSTVWRFHGPQVGTWHPAPFSEELPKRCLEAIGRDEIVVLDPFAGSCTTLKVALAFGYDAIGVDTSEEYLKRAAEENGWTYTSVT